METFDLTTVSNNNVVPSGTYTASVSGVRSKVSKSGNPMLIVNYSLRLDGKELEVPQFIVLSQKSLFMVARSLPILLEAAGEYDYYDQVKQSVSQETFNHIVNSGMLLGANLSITVKQDQFDGEKRSTVSSIKPISDGDDVATSGDFFLEA